MGKCMPVSLSKDVFFLDDRTEGRQWQSEDAAVRKEEGRKSDWCESEGSTPTPSPLRGLPASDCSYYCVNYNWGWWVTRQWSHRSDTCAGLFYIYIYVYIYIYIYIYICMYVCICMYIYICIPTTLPLPWRKHISMRQYVCICIYVMYVCIRVHVYAYIHRCIFPLHSHIYIYVCIHMYIYPPRCPLLFHCREGYTFWCVGSSHAINYINIYVWIYTHTFVYICIYIYIYASLPPFLCHEVDSILMHQLFARNQLHISV